MNDNLGTRRGSRKAQTDGPHGPATAAGTPATIFGANLIVWAKADVGVTLSGSNVTGWADQSGNGNNFVVANASPTFNATGFNGSFPGITHTSAQGLKTSVFNINSAVAGFFLVGNFTTSAGSNARILAYFDPFGSADYQSLHGVLALNNMAAGNINCLQNSIASAAMAVTTGTNIRLGTTFNGPTGTVNTYVNNGAPTSTGGFGNNTQGTATTLLDIGWNQAAVGEAMTIAEVVMVNIVPSAGQLTSLDNYFRSKWGL